MTDAVRRSFSLPVEDELGLHRMTNASGLRISMLPNGCVFAIEHLPGGEPVLINQVLGSPMGSGIGRVLLRLGAEKRPVQIAGPGAKALLGAAADRFVWTGETGGVRHQVTLWLHPDAPFWLWRIDLENTAAEPCACDAILIQDLGLAARGLVLSNEAYISHYIDHAIEAHPRFGPVVMSRQNATQSGQNPWLAQGCIEGAARFATDASQLFGPDFRALGDSAPGFGDDLPGIRLQHEAACMGVQSRPAMLGAGESATRRFFALYEPHHPGATSAADLARLDAVEPCASAFQSVAVPCSAPPQSILQDAAPLSGPPATTEDIAARYRERTHEEWQGGALLSFFVPDGPLNRHVVLAAKERQMRRRHGAILRGGDAMLPDDATLSATCWMHGVFAAQLTIGNTALHKLVSVSRDPHNVTQASGLRILADRGDGWRLLTVPSLFEMGLNDCRWIYRLDDGAIEVHALVCAEDTAMQWHVTASDSPCRFAVVAHLVLGEHEFRHPGLVEIDAAAKRIGFRPDPLGLWGRHYPQAVHHLVTSTPGAVAAIGSGALLYRDNAPRAADAYTAILTAPTDRLCFAIVGALDDPAHAERLAAKYERAVDGGAMLRQAGAYWSGVTRATRFSRDDPDSAALDTIFPWLAQNAMVHLSAPRGLEQYTAGAWGTRDVCQGPVEFLLPLGHAAPVRDILRIVFAQQYESSGDWPQWFMPGRYRHIRDPRSHGDILIWPLKALCDYLEATDDLAFLAEPLPWATDTGDVTARRDPVAAHVATLLATVAARFIPGTHLIRLGAGDWNDAMQPADPAMPDWMASSWTVALVYEQVARYGRILRRAGQSHEADDLDTLAAGMREDFHRHLMPGGTVAGYALFKPEGGPPEWLIHPSDTRTGLRYSLIPITRAITAGLFTPEQTLHHLALLREHLLFPDGVRLMDRPVPYRGGIEVNFRRAESAAFFGREIGLMYVQAHLRYCEAMGHLGDTGALRAGLRLANPISVTEALPQASLRQRNAYFSSSDAAFPDRDRASADWARARDGTVAVDAGWRVYSSGPGVFCKLALRYFKAVLAAAPQHTQP